MQYSTFHDLLMLTHVAGEKMENPLNDHQTRMGALYVHAATLFLSKERELCVFLIREG
jgi:hypothetical protein